ncbi:MAG: DUF4340 domain-containing protein [Candidatus Obscuribacterales bacterium]|nr:DUF4340 domain-containing protein [Candidatus Obscuribacterales bacterium]
MSKTVAILSTILVVQIGLTFGLSYFESERAKEATKNLISADLSQVTEIDFETKSKATLKLVKDKGQWVLPEFHNFPASKETVDLLLEKFKSISRGWPVATTEDALSRFKLKADDFEEKITLKSNSANLVTLLLGSTAGHNKLHVRLDNENEIHTVEIPLRQVSPNKEDWIDRSAVELDTEKITAVQLPNFSLVKKGKEWLIDYAGKSAVLDDTAANDVLTAAGGINISEVLGTEDKPEYGLATPVFQYEVTMNDGAKLVYKFGKLSGGNFFVLKQPKGEFYLKVDAWFLDRVRNEAPDALTKKSELMRKLKASSKSGAVARPPADQRSGPSPVKEDESVDEDGGLPPPPIRTEPTEEAPLPPPPVRKDKGAAAPPPAVPTKN